MIHRVAAILLACAAFAATASARAEPPNGRTSRARTARMSHLDLDSSLRGRSAADLEPTLAAGAQVQSVAPVTVSTTYAAQLVITAATSAPDARALLEGRPTGGSDRPAVDHTSAASRTPLRILAGLALPTGSQTTVLLRPTASVDLSTMGLLARGSFFSF